MTNGLSKRGLWGNVLCMTLEELIGFVEESHLSIGLGEWGGAILIVFGMSGI